MTDLEMLSSATNYICFQSLNALVFGLCSLPFSQPLYFGYFLFFLPDIVKLLSFLSPLFVTTALVLISLVLEPDLVLLLVGERHGLSEELEMYKFLFEKPEDDGVLGREERETVDKFLIHGATTAKEEAIFQEKNEFGEISSASHVEGQEVKPHGTLSKKVVIVGGGQREESNANAEVGNKITLPMRPGSRKFSLSFDGIEVHGEMSPGLGSFGSMRKEKEWRRTLACKLFEERHNDGGGEERMDLLWERYEDDSSRRKERKKGDPVPKVVKPKLPEELEGEVEAEEDGSTDQMCCLQALKFSAGKMNLGIGRPNILRISRALTGMGWLHNAIRHKRV